MNEKVAKKIGEAHAFARVLSTTFSSNKSVMSELFGDYAPAILDVTAGQRSDLGAIAGKYEMSDIVLPKSERTAAKITTMGEMYVGDDWDDVAEVLEWMSFFVGGAIVHWQLIAGSAEVMQDEELLSIAQTGTGYYADLMSQLRLYSVVVGGERARIE